MILRELKSLIGVFISTLIIASFVMFSSNDEQNVHSGHDYIATQLSKSENTTIQYDLRTNVLNENSNEPLFSKWLAFIK